MNWSYRSGSQGACINGGYHSSPVVQFSQTSLFLLVFFGVDFDVIHVSPDDERREANARPGTHQAPHERVYGLVERPEAEDGAGEPENAQFWDL